MFRQKSNPELEELNREISRLLVILSTLNPDDEDYATINEQLGKLYAQKEKIPTTRIDPNTLLSISANVLITFIIVGHERANVITSKAFNFLGKTAR